MKKFLFLSAIILVGLVGINSAAAQVNTPSGVKIRSGAGTNYAKVGSIKNKTVVTIVDESKGAGANLWGKLSDGRGWIAVDYTVKEKN